MSFGSHDRCRLLRWRGRSPCADRSGTVLDNPSLPEEICAEPLLGALKLIAWCGEERLLPRSGARGFPHWGVWLQRNARFSADLAPFAAGLPGTASGLATRCGRSLRLPEAMPGRTLRQPCATAIQSKGLVTKKRKAWQIEWQMMLQVGGECRPV